VSIGFSSPLQAAATALGATSWYVFSLVAPRTSPAGALALTGRGSAATATTIQAG